VSALNQVPQKRILKFFCAGVFFTFCGTYKSRQILIQNSKPFQLYFDRELGLSKIVFRFLFCVASLNLKPSNECKSSHFKSKKTILKCTCSIFDFKSTKLTLYRLFDLKNRLFGPKKSGTL